MQLIATENLKHLQNNMFLHKSSKILNINKCLYGGAAKYLSLNKYISIIPADLHVVHLHCINYLNNYSELICMFNLIFSYYSYTAKIC